MRGGRNHPAWAYPSGVDFSGAGFRGQARSSPAPGSRVTSQRVTGASKRCEAQIVLVLLLVLVLVLEFGRLTRVLR